MYFKQLKNFVLLLALVLMMACSAKTSEDSKTVSEDDDEWKAMDDFHMVMAETFHPYKDSANLEPVKSRAGELLTSAESWASSSLPERVDSDETAEKLQSLKAACSKLVETVGSGSDEEIGSQLTIVHDVFHDIQEAWYDAGSKHGDDHGHDH